MVGACWWVLDSRRIICGRCWRWWSRRRDRAAELGVAGSGAGGADLASGGGDGHEVWLRPTGGAGESGDWWGPVEWAFVCFSLAAWRPIEDIAVGPGRVCAVVQAAGSGGVQAAASGRRDAGGGVAGERVGDGAGRDRCLETETGAALSTRGENQPGQPRKSCGLRELTAQYLRLSVSACRGIRLGQLTRGQRIAASAAAFIARGTRSREATCGSTGQEG